MLLYKFRIESYVKHMNYFNKLNILILIKSTPTMVKHFFILGLYKIRSSRKSCKS